MTFLSEKNPSEQCFLTGFVIDKYNTFKYNLCKGDSDKTKQKMTGQNPLGMISLFQEVRKWTGLRA